MPAASYRGVVGIAKEATAGTPVAPTDYIPWTAASIKNVPGYIEDKGVRGSMVSTYNYIPGVQHGDLSFGGPAMADTLGFLLQSVLPNVADTGASPPYTHTFAALNSGTGQPTTYTITDYDGIQALAYPYFKVSDLGLKFAADGLLEYTAKGLSLAPVTASNPTASYSAVSAYAGWQPAVTINSVARTTSNVLLDAEIDFKRTVTVVPGASGSATPLFVWSGVLDVSGKFTLVYDTTADYLIMLNNTAPVVNISFTQGAGAAVTQIMFNMTNCSYTAAETDRGGDFVKLAVTWSGRANTTDIGASGGYSPIKVTLQSAKAAAAYQ